MSHIDAKPIRIIALILILVTGVLAGCQQTESTLDVESPTSDVLDMPTTLPTLPSIPVRTPTPPSIPVRTPTPVDVPDDFFLGLTSDCSLPCWQGIEVGRSSVHDTLITLTELYGTPPTLSSLEDVPVGYEGLFPAWVFGPPTNNSFAATLIYNRQSRVLEALRLSWLGSRFASHLTLQRIFLELGAPQHILFSYQLGGQGYITTNIQYFVLYSNGVGFFQATSVPAVASRESDTDERTIELCLDDLSGGGSVSITTPLPNNLDDLTSVQEYVHRGYGDLAKLVRIEDLFQIAPEELARQVSMDSVKCLTTVISPAY